jgi:hypothetical protein
VTGAFQLGKHLPLVVEVTLAYDDLSFGMDDILGDPSVHCPPPSGFVIRIEMGECGVRVANSLAAEGGIVLSGAGAKRRIWAKCP